MTTKTQTLYFNKGNVSASRSRISSNHFQGTGDFKIGCYQNNTDCLTGSVDDVRVYKVALSATEAAAIYNGGSGDLAAYYPRQVAYVGVPFSLQVEATQGPESFSAGSILAAKGLGIQSTTGLISGTPNAVGDFNSTVTVTNPSGSQSKSFFFRVLKGNRSLDWNQTIAGLSYGDANFSLAANATGTGNLYYSSSDSSVVEILSPSLSGSSGPATRIQITKEYFSINPPLPQPVVGDWTQ
jgi:hypothetical protein